MRFPKPKVITLVNIQILGDGQHGEELGRIMIMIYSNGQTSKRIKK